MAAGALALAAAEWAVSCAPCPRSARRDESEQPAAAARPVQPNPPPFYDRPPPNEQAFSTAAPHAPLLSFTACNGLANQRLSLVYGLVLARLTGRAALLPDLVADGTQDAAVGYPTVVPARGAALPFEGFYDLAALRAAAAKHGVRVFGARAAHPLPAPLPVPLGGRIGAAFEGALLRDYAAVQHVALDCPLWGVGAATLAAHEAFVLDVLAALVPAPARAAAVDALVARLGAVGCGGGARACAFDALHLRYEDDWLRHCDAWTSIRDGVTRDNCGVLSPLALVAKLATQGVGAGGAPLFVAVQEGQLRDPALLAALRRAFNVVTKAQLQPPGAAAALSREEAALLDYFVCLRARTFVGNSVSSFSALLIAERRAAGAVATWYNGGNVPLEELFPVFRVPWIFTYND